MALLEQARAQLLTSTPGATCPEVEVSWAELQRDAVLLQLYAAQHLAWRAPVGGGDGGNEAPRRVRLDLQACLFLLESHPDGRVRQQVRLRPSLAAHAARGTSYRCFGPAGRAQRAAACRPAHVRPCVGRGGPARCPSPPPGGGASQRARGVGAALLRAPAGVCCGGGAQGRGTALGAGVARARTAPSGQVRHGRTGGTSAAWLPANPSARAPAAGVRMMMQHTGGCPGRTLAGGPHPPGACGLPFCVRRVQGHEAPAPLSPARTWLGGGTAALAFLTDLLRTLRPAAHALHHHLAQLQHAPTSSRSTSAPQRPRAAAPPRGQRQLAPHDAAFLASRLVEARLGGDARSGRALAQPTQLQLLRGVSELLRDLMGVWLEPVDLPPLTSGPGEPPAAASAAAAPPDAAASADGGAEEREQEEEEEEDGDPLASRCTLLVHAELRALLARPADRPPPPTPAPGKAADGATLDAPDASEAGGVGSGGGGALRAFRVCHERRGALGTLLVRADGGDATQYVSRDGFLPPSSSSSSAADGAAATPALAPGPVVLLGLEPCRTAGAARGTAWALSALLHELGHALHMVLGWHAPHPPAPAPASSGRQPAAAAGAHATLGAAAAVVQLPLELQEVPSSVLELLATQPEAVLRVLRGARARLAAAAAASASGGGEGQRGAAPSLEADWEEEEEEEWLWQRACEVAAHARAAFNSPLELQQQVRRASGAFDAGAAHESPRGPRPAAHASRRAAAFIPSPRLPPVLSPRICASILPASPSAAAPPRRGVAPPQASRPAQRLV